MTESEWLVCANPDTMLAYLEGKASDRKLRLFACACCRRSWSLMSDKRSRTAVEVAEQYADLLVTEGELDDARDAAWDAAWATAWNATWAAAKDAAWNAARGTAWDAARAAARDAADAASAAARVAARVTAWVAARAAAWDTQCQLLRDIVGNPFQGTRLLPDWVTPTVTTLAQATYLERLLPSGELDQVRLAILADALEEAGCYNDKILGHLRHAGLHGRGCWVVDLCLNKE